jgi:hypothetical protein
MFSSDLPGEEMYRERGGQSECERREGGREGKRENK